LAKISELPEKEREKLKEKIKTIIETVCYTNEPPLDPQTIDFTTLWRGIQDLDAETKEWMSKVRDALLKIGASPVTIDRVTGVITADSLADLNLEELRYCVKSLTESIENLKDSVYLKIGEEHYSKILDNLEELSQIANTINDELQKTENLLVDLIGKLRRKPRAEIPYKRLLGRLEAQRESREKIEKQLRELQEKLKKLEKRKVWVVIKPFKEALTTYKEGEEIAIPIYEEEKIKWAEEKTKQGYLLPKEEYEKMLIKTTPEMEEAIKSLEQLLRR